jgi:hypothetical protein
MWTQPENQSMQSRRYFLRNTLLTALATTDLNAFASLTSNFSGDEVLSHILSKAESNDWKSLPIGELMGNIAQELLGTKYVGGVLDRSPNGENCTVDLNGLDCVTFFETTLDLARMIKKGERTPAALMKEVSFTRYRGGIVNGYTSRLHYTSDWISDNEQKHVVKPLFELPGSEDFKQAVDFMSSHPNSYPQLAAHPRLIPEMKKREHIINSRKLKFIPMEKISAIEPLLKTGDIVGICTNLPGLDIVHTGIILRDKEGVPHFMDASSKKSSMKVTIEPGPISGAIKWSDHNIGIMLARPLEPQ